MLGGDEAFVFPVVLMGGVGAISAAAHLCTARFVAMVECGLAGKLEDGRAHAEALLPDHPGRFAEPNPAVFKGVLHAQGRIATPDVRMPLTNASDDAVHAARRGRRRVLTAASGGRPPDRDLTPRAGGPRSRSVRRHGFRNERLRCGMVGCRTGDRPPGVERAVER